MSARTLTVGRQDAGQTVAAVLHRRLGLSWSRARQAVARGLVRVNGRPCPDPARRVAAGARIEVRPAGGEARKQPPRKAAPLRSPPPPRPALPPGVPRPVVVYSDESVVVADKPAGLTTMRHPEEAAEFGERGKRYLPPTLADLLPPLLGEFGRARPLRAVHRIDKETSGLVVFARTPEAERHLAAQFRAHTIERRYLALVRGRPPEGRIESRLVRDRGDGRRGSTPDPNAGRRAVTHVRVLEELGPFSLVECRLETGRTHQVRIHLGEQGTPLCGERVYDRPLHGPPVPDASGAGRVMLHAAVLGFRHPQTGEWVRWEAEPPAYFRELLERLRRESGHPSRPDR
ncbi:MAG TPA: RluA family pseudouridine synthase [Gemmataceae bacterium]